MENSKLDLFENYKDIPANLLILINEFEEKDNSYSNCKKLLKKCVKIGYSFDYGLDAIPYNLQKIQN
jgi:hypothetical protein